MRSLIVAHPLAALVTPSSDGLGAEHIPMLFVESSSQAMLHGHVARANPVWQNVTEGSEVLAIFQGPNMYISPKSYPSKREHGKVVPTWNYLVVHARGKIHWQHDSAWLRNHVEDASVAHESRENPWRVSDAPADFIARMLAAIVGFEIQVTALKGKWKLSQNRTAVDRQGVIDALKSEDSSVAAEMLSWMEREGGAV
jgi:transcriptional regulator